jgi:pimeloyl-ACP methyl ester carboxylesterase
MIKFPEDKYINVNGLKARYWAEGDSGPQVLFIHGIGASVEYWHKNIHELSKNYRVLAVDMPGFGKSDKPDADYTLEFYSEFLTEFCKVMKCEELVVVGHSLGGGMAMQFAIEHGKRVKKLILVDNVGFAKQVTIFFRLMAVPVIGRLFLKLSKKLFAFALRGNVHHGEVISDELVDVLYPLNQAPLAIRTLKYIVKHNTDLAGIRAATLKPIWDHMDKIREIPTLVCWGKDDNLLSAKVHVPEIKKWLPHVRLELFDDCGHIPQMEHPKKFNKLFDEFVKS